MCTILTITKDMYGTEAATRIIDDAIRGNEDGWSLLLTDAQGKAVAQLNSMLIEAIFAVIEGTGDWHRMFLHSRLATGGSDVKLQNVHGFQVNGVYYMHNGFICSDGARNLDVDSMQIGKWIGVDVNYALDRLLEESYANVFMIDVDDGVYWVHRSKAGTLYTDGDGNYSTNPFGNINQEVTTFQQFYHDLPDFSGTSYLDDEEEEIETVLTPTKKVGT